MPKSKTKKESAAEWIPIGDLTPWAENPRKNEAAVSHVAESIQRFGFASPIIARTGGEVIAGHTRLLAAQQLGLDRVPVRYMDLDPVDAKLLALADNKVAEIADWDDEGLERILSELKADGVDLDGLGWSDDELADILNEETEGLTDEDQVPEPPEQPVTVEGDLWILGDHRLLCGDSTKLETVERLMDGEKADMVFTDPPYGIGFEYNSHKDVTGEEYLEFCRKWFVNLTATSEFIVISTGWKYNKFWFNADPTDCFYWLCKNKRTGGKISHFRKVEPVFIWGKPENKYDFDFWEQTTEIEEDLKGVHTCPKPSSLITAILEGVGSDRLVLDVFLGSGTTLIACEKTRRKCYGMELDPTYCDVIINRWQDFTGSKATLESTGQTYDELKEERLASD